MPTCAGRYCTADGLARRHFRHVSRVDQFFVVQPAQSQYASPTAPRVFSCRSCLSCRTPGMPSCAASIAASLGLPSPHRRQVPRVAQFWVRQPPQCQ
mmetsp:Transcript_37808/g.122949  ORF Transcript_37808/g.122949 Transcript_37808/m.122949 type:complete len:97 (+) Transcript_37808:530-820(+)